MIDTYTGTTIFNNTLLLNLDVNEANVVSAKVSCVTINTFVNDYSNDSTERNYVAQYTMSRDNLGIGKVPKRGDTLSFVSSNWMLHFSRAYTLLADGRYLVNEDMVYVIGDNWLDALDSRFYGPVPVSHIIGCVIGGGASK